MNPIQTRTRGRRTSLAVVLALVAAAFALVVPSASAEVRYVVTGKVLLSSQSPVNGAVLVSRADSPSDTFVPAPELSGPITDGLLDLDLPAAYYRFELVSDVLPAHRWYAGGGSTAADESGAADVHVAASTALGTVTMPSRNLTVTVVDEHSQPVPNAGVSYGLDPGDLVENSRTDANGVAVLRDRPIDQPLYVQAADDAFAPSAVETVAAGTGNVPVSLEMTRRAVIQGKVTGTGNVGLGLVSVAAFDSSQVGVGTPALTDAQGNFTITGVPATTDVSLVFTDNAGEYAAQYLGGVTDINDAVTFDVAANTPVTGKDAQLVLNPASSDATDLTGVVTGAAGALPGVVVQASRNGVVKASTRTHRDGRYTFTDLTSGTYQVEYRWAIGQPGALPYADQAAQVAVTEDAPGADRNVTLKQFGRIAGTLKDGAGQPIAGSSVSAIDGDGTTTSVDATATGAFTLAVAPGTYRIRFAGPAGGRYITEYWNNAASLAESQVVTATSGATTGGLNAQLSKTLDALVQPAVSGKSLVGSTLVASAGSWNLTSGNDYAYTWLRGGTTPVGTGATYKLTAADVGTKMVVQVVASHGDRSGTAKSAGSTVVKRPSATKVTGTSPKAKVVKLTVTVSGTGLANPGGTLTIKRGTTTVKTKVAVVNGKAVVTLKAQPKGKQAYTAVYSGTSAVVTSTSPKATVKVK